MPLVIFLTFMNYSKLTQTTVVLNLDFSSFSDPIFIDFGRLPTWNCPVEDDKNVRNDDINANVISEDPIIDYDDSQKISDLDFVEDQESEPSINHRRKYKGKYK